MDLSKKSSPYDKMPLPIPLHLHQAQQAISSSSFSVDVKGEYIEEDIIKEESEHIHVDPQSYFSPQILSQSPSSSFLPTLASTPSSHISRLSYPSPLYPHAKLYPSIPPYSSIYSAIPHPLANLQSFQQLHSTTSPAAKRKTSSPTKLVKKPKHGSPSKPNQLSDTRNGKLPQMDLSDPIMPMWHHENEKVWKSQSEKSEFHKSNDQETPQLEANPVHPNEETSSTSTGKSTIDCPVCGDTAIAHFHYGGMCCYSCKAFFRRVVNTYKVRFYKVYHTKT